MENNENLVVMSLCQIGERYQKNSSIGVLITEPTPTTLSEVEELIEMQNRFRKLVKDVEDLDVPALSDIYRDCRDNCNGDSPWIDYITEEEREKFIKLYSRYLIPLRRIVRLDNNVWVDSVRAIN